MAIAFDSTSGAQTGWTTSNSFSHTCSGSDRLLLVWVYFDRGAGAYYTSALTYNGSALTQVGTFTVGTAGYGELWALVNPASGTNTLSATYSNAGPTAKVAIRALSYNGVNQTTAYGTLATSAGTSTTATVNVTSATDELVVSGVVSNEGGVTLTVGADQTQRYIVHQLGGGGVWSAIFSDEPGAATTTASAGLNSSLAWGIAALPLKPLTTDSGVPKTTKLTLLGVG